MENNLNKTQVINNNKFLGLKEVRNIVDNISTYFKKNVIILKIELTYDNFANVIVLLGENKYSVSFSYDIYKVDYLLSKKVEE